MPNLKATLKIDFAVVGGTKAGTTSIHRWLSKSRQVSSPKVKEMHFFSQGLFVDGQHHLETECIDEWEYFSGFKSSNEKLKGDFDPLTLHGPKSIELLKRFGSQVRIIVVLRNPIHRAISYYQMDVREGFETRSMREAVILDWEKWQYRKSEKVYTPLIQLGFYSQRIMEFKKTFGDYLKVILYDDLVKNGSEVGESMCRFIGITSNTLMPLSSVETNIRAEPRNNLVKLILRLRTRGIPRWIRDSLYIKLPSKVRNQIRANMLFRKSKTVSVDKEVEQILKEIYRSDIKQLEDVLGEGLPAWTNISDAG